MCSPSFPTSACDESPTPPFLVRLLTPHKCGMFMIPWLSSFFFVLLLGTPGVYVVALEYGLADFVSFPVISTSATPSAHLLLLCDPFTFPRYFTCLRFSLDAFTLSTISRRRGVFFGPPPLAPHYQFRTLFIGRFGFTPPNHLFRPSPPSVGVSLVICGLFPPLSVLSFSGVLTRYIVYLDLS